jgi:alginate O-acetyltransferase complex protein AlgI
MLFTSPTFIVFFALVFALYWKVRTLPRQNVVLLLASYVFYGAWSWKFLALLWFSTLFDYACGLAIAASPAQTRKRYVMVASVCCNLLLLGTLKYAHFFVAEATQLLSSLGLMPHPVLLHIVLPIGISFYTFQSMSYVIDVYRGKLPAVRRLRDYALYVAFFPQLVAGPIERATHLLPQLLNERKFDMVAVRTGLSLALWGLFKKMVIGDNLAPWVNAVWTDPSSYSGVALSTAVVFFAFQIYCDFSGYTDCARGVARMLGIDLILNFNLPYLARNPVDFWRRWHISLSTWFQDYLYFPLAMRYMRRGGWASKYRAHVISMALIGLWHGASWTFLIFGLYWGLVLAGYLYWQENHRRSSEASGALQSAQTVLSILATFIAVLIGWVLFRADDLSSAWYVYGHLFSTQGLSDVRHPDVVSTSILWTMIIGLFATDCVIHARPMVVGELLATAARRRTVRYGLVFGIVLSYLVALQTKLIPFIYFQF